MTWGEAHRMVEVLAVDPSSHIGAALAGWLYPADRLTLAVLDLFDLQNQVALSQGGSKRKAKRYPRPWPDKSKSTTKPSADLTQDEIVAALRMAGHTADLPTAA
jgi:hypothetical protein